MLTRERIISSPTGVKMKISTSHLEPIGARDAEYFLQV